MQIPGHHAIGSPFEQRQAAGAVAAQSSAASSSASGSASSSSGTANATITANDFLQLLVTELQNQDPTADTDPNEYVDQLVQVNSLQQLIQINQTLSSAVPTTSTGGTSGSVPAFGANQASVRATANLAAPTQSALAPPSVQSAAMTSTPAPIEPSSAPGNLSIPASSPAALRVAGALGPRERQ